MGNENTNIEVHERPVLLDRVQVTISPNYSDIFDLNEKLSNGRYKLVEKYENYKDLIIENGKLHNSEGYKSERSFPNGKMQYFVVLPESETPVYVTNVKVSAFAPFVVAMKINFIRLLRYKLKTDSGFRRDYDKYILLDEDNYINYENWPYWDSGLVSSLLNDLNDVCMDVADSAMCRLLPFHDIPYCNAVVNQIESNIDFYVGNNNSLFVSKQYPKFIYSDGGEDFKKRILAIAVKCRVPDDDFDNDIESKEKNSCHSVGFQISKDLYFKIYRKDKDHIRAELMFNKGFLQRKFRRKYQDEYDYEKTTVSRNVKSIVKPVMEFSKSFFKAIDLTDIFYSILSDQSNVVSLNQLNDLHDFYLRSQPEMIPIIDSIVNNVPVVDSETITYLRKHSNMRKQFVRVYYGNGKWIYVYEPVKAERLRAEAFKNKYAKPKPFQKSLRYGWETVNTNTARELLAKEFERVDYRKQFPYSNDFIGNNKGAM